MIAGLFFSLEGQHVDVARMEEPPIPFPWPRWEPLLVELIEHGRPHQSDANMPILPLSQHRILRERRLQALDVSDHTQDDSHRVAHHHFLAHRYSVCAPRAHMAKVPLQKQAMLDVPARKRNLLECAAPAHQIVFGGGHCTSLRLRVRTLSTSTSSTGCSLKDHGMAEDECWTMWRSLSSRPRTSRQTIPMRHKQLQNQFGKSWAQTEMWLTHTTTEQVHQHHTHLLVGQVACCVNVFGSRDPWSGQLCQLSSCAQRFGEVWHLWHSTCATHHQRHEGHQGHQQHRGHQGLRYHRFKQREREEITGACFQRPLLLLGCLGGRAPDPERARRPQAAVSEVRGRARESRPSTWRCGRCRIAVLAALLAAVPDDFAFNDFKRILG